LPPRDPHGWQLSARSSPFPSLATVSRTAASAHASLGVVGSSVGGRSRAHGLISMLTMLQLAPRHHIYASGYLAPLALTRHVRKWGASGRASSARQGARRGSAARRSAGALRLRHMTRAPDQGRILDFAAGSVSPPPRAPMRCPAGVTAFGPAHLPFPAHHRALLQSSGDTASHPAQSATIDTVLAAHGIQALPGSSRGSTHVRDYALLAPLAVTAMGANRAHLRQLQFLGNLLNTPP
jgi:hypothetical protein